MSKEERNKLVILVGIVIITLGITIIFLDSFKGKEPQKEKKEIVDVDYTTNIIKKSNNGDNKNYLISPYNIKVALNMLKEGADGNTKEEIEKVLSNETISNINIPDKLNVANGVFIKDVYKDYVKKDFISVLDSKYKAEVLYDKFTTPDVINNWVKDKTNGMIEKLLDNMNADFVLGLASALALDVEWTNQFECINTTSEEFTNIDNSKTNVEMMHQTYTSYAKYIKTDDVEGIILPYVTNDEIELEFVGILPNTSVNDYISSLTKEKINNLFTTEKQATDKYHINLSLPRFTYSYEIEDFITVLENMGIKDAFNPEKANFKKMIDMDVYVGEAIHKTKIELNEKGTKAAAVTYFGMFKNSIMPEKDYEEVDIKFNKPFVYMIREKNNGEILFFGTVFEPNKWTASTCANDKLN